MIKPLMMPIVFVLLSTPLLAGQPQSQQSHDAANLDAFRFLVGEWVGEGNDSMTFRFDIAPPGKPEAFSKYIEGSLHRKPAAK